MMRTAFPLVGLSIAASLFVFACGDDEDGGDDGAGNTGNRPEETGAICEAADDCYPDVAEGAILGEIECLDRVRGGYCTHSCESDEDCCAAEGECKTDLLQVCSPFEAMEGKSCFLSCEPEDVDRAPEIADEQEFCQREASTDFICRSSGGGSQNRKVCVPGDCGVGAGCASADDCDSGLECVTRVRGGYCTVPGCESNADCPGDTLCLAAAGGNYCVRPCATASDCSFCRRDGFFASCSDEVTFAEDGTTGSVCVPPL